MAFEGGLSSTPKPSPCGLSWPLLGLVLGVAAQYAQDSNIPKIVLAFFFAMVVNDVVELGLTSRLSTECMMWVMQQLDWAPIEFWLENIDHKLRRAQAAHAANPPVDPTCFGGPVEDLGLSDAPPASIMSSSCSSSGHIPEGLVGLQVAGHHPHLPSLPTFINSRVVAGIPLKNQCRQPKKIPYAVSLFDPDTPSWSSCEYSIAPSILSPEVEVRQMVKTKSTPHIRSLDELLAEGTLEGPNTPGRAMLKKRGCTLTEPVPEVVAARLSPHPGTTYAFLLRRASYAALCVPLGRLAPVYTIQRTPKETGDLEWYCFNNRPGYMMAIEKKLKVKHWKYDFLFVCRDVGWGDLLRWNEEKRVRNPLGESSDEEQKMARYFLYYIREDDCLRPVPKFMAEVIESIQGPEKKRSKSKQVRAKLMPFESGDATPMQVAGEVEHRHKKEMACQVAMAAKKLADRSVSGQTPGHQRVAGTPEPVQAVSQIAAETPAGARARLKNFLSADSTTKLELVQELARSWDVAVSGTSEPLKVTEDEVAVVKALTRPMKAMSERCKLEEAAARYKRCWEKLREEKDTWEAKKKDLQSRLNMALS
ncbi:hypothetical protein Cgig2_014994 [Carnegiea gigantea]|uniref:Uncharacterized protein n=1 Tax=Carnegiea gigantea TaxID=171969 RepID=A0A9Q1KKV4_9CARY|nr:hypothetical protein Cgig2_014994 [Carnegiea gigantea]